MSLSALEHLTLSLSRTDDWLRFAEAKNGALIVFVGVALFGTSRLVVSIEISVVLLTYLIVCGLQLLAALVICLLSFIPRLEPPWWVKFPEKKKNPNLLFFGDACALSAQQYIEQASKISGNQMSPNSMEIQVAQQIVVNSRIAFIKFKQFQIAVWFVLSSILTPFGAYLLHRIRV